MQETQSIKHIFKKHAKKPKEVDERPLKKVSLAAKQNRYTHTRTNTIRKTLGTGETREQIADWKPPGYLEAP